MAEEDRVWSQSYPDHNHEYSFRSLVRGDFESKHFGTVTWLALEKFRKHLLDRVLSWNGQQLPAGLWTIALNNYIDNNQYILDIEKKRWEFQYRWYTEPNMEHDFFDRNRLVGHEELEHLEVDIDNYSYIWSEDYNSDSHHIYVRAASRVFNIISGNIEYVGLNSDYPETATIFPPSHPSSHWTFPPSTYIEGNSIAGNQVRIIGDNWFYPFIATKEVSSGTTNDINNVYCRLGEEGEFDLYFPEYDEYGAANVVQESIGETEFYSHTDYQQIYTHVGLLDDLYEHLENLRDLNYDYSNLDECLTKNWLYLKKSDTCIEPVGQNEVVSEYPYYNELYVNDVLSDSYLLITLDTHPCVEYVQCAPDIIVREKVAKPAFEPKVQELAGDIEKYGYNYGREYSFQPHILIYQPTSMPFCHGPDDPHCIDGIEYTCLEENGQPNEGNPGQYKFTPVRIQVKCQIPINGETIFKIDSITYASNSKIAPWREIILRNLLDNRLSLFDTYEGTDYYNKHVTKEFP